MKMVSDLIHLPRGIGGLENRPDRYFAPSSRHIKEP